MTDAVKFMRFSTPHGIYSFTGVEWGKEGSGKKSAVVFGLAFLKLLGFWPFT